MQIVAEVVTSANAVTVSNTIPGTPALEFRFKHGPTDYEASMDSAGKLVLTPRLKKGLLTPGSQGIRSMSAGGIMPALMTWASDGCRVIPIDAPVIVHVNGKLEKRRGYLTRLKAEKGRYHYADVWTHPVLMGGKKVDWDSNFDKVGWTRTIAMWSDMGMLCEVSTTVVTYLLSQEIRRAQRAVSRKQDDKADYHFKVCDLLEAKLDTLTGRDVVGLELSGEVVESDPEI